MDIWRTAIVAIIVGLSAACARQGALPNPSIEALADGIFMIPVDRDEAGCVRYRVISEKRPDDFTVYWRIAEGYYTNNRASADCKPRKADYQQ